MAMMKNKNRVALIMGEITKKGPLIMLKKTNFDA
jgi:hypothetical protein